MGAHSRLPLAGGDWSLPRGTTSVHVVDGRSGATLADVLARPAEDSRELVRDVARASSVPVQRMRLVWAGQQLSKGPLPPELVAGGGSKTVKLIRVEPGWHEALAHLAEGALPPLDPPLGAAGRRAAKAPPRTMDEALLRNRDFMLAAVQEAGGSLSRASEELKGDREVVLAAVQENGDALRFASEELRGDREVVLAAVSGNGGALRFASEELRGDAEVVGAAVAEHGEALRFASAELRLDRRTMISAVRQTASACRHVHPTMQQDAAFLRLAALANGDVFLHIPEELRRDRGIAVAASTFWSDGRASAAAARALRQQPAGTDELLAQDRPQSSPAVMQRRVAPLHRFGSHRCKTAIGLAR